MARVKLKSWRVERTSDVTTSVAARWPGAGALSADLISCSHPQSASRAIGVRSEGVEGVGAVSRVRDSAGLRPRAKLPSAPPHPPSESAHARRRVRGARLRPDWSARMQTRTPAAARAPGLCTAGGGESSVLLQRIVRVGARGRPEARPRLAGRDKTSRTNTWTHRCVRRRLEAAPLGFVTLAGGRLEAFRAVAICTPGQCRRIRAPLIPPASQNHGNPTPALLPAITPPSLQIGHACAVSCTAATQLEGGPMCIDMAVYTIAKRKSLVDLPYDILACILPYLSKSDLRQFTATCRAGRTLATPYLVHSVTLRTAMQLTSFCMFMTRERLPLLRAIALSRFALHFGSAMLADVLEHAPALEEVHLEESEHIIRRYQPIFRVLAKAPRVRRLRLELGAALLRESQRASMSSFGLLRAHCGSLQVLALRGFQTAWDWDAALCWPQVRELTLDASSIRGPSLARAFPGLRVLRLANSWLGADERTVAPAVYWAALDTLVCDGRSLSSLTLARPVRCLELTRFALPEREPDPSRDVWAEFVGTVSPCAATLRAAHVLDFLPHWCTMVLALSRMRFLDLSFEGHNQVPLSQLAPLPLVYLCLAWYANPRDSWMRPNMAFDACPGLRYLELARGGPGRSREWWTVRRTRAGRVAGLESMTEDMGLAVRAEWINGNHL